MFMLKCFAFAITLYFTTGDGIDRDIIEDMDIQEIRDELMKMKTENEKIKDDLEDRVAQLEDLIKVSVLRSCAEYSHYGLKASGRFMIDPDGPLLGQDPFQVYCNFSTGATEVMHDTETITEVGHCIEPGCYQKDISYINGLTAQPIDMNQIVSLMELAEYCEQEFYYECFLAPFQRNGVNYVWWKDRQGEENVYFTGSHHDYHVCDCHYSPDGCYHEETDMNRCNCDANIPVTQTDTGTITNMTALPVMKLYFGGLEFQSEIGKFQIGRLKCYGEKRVDIATSCSSLKKEGVMTSGYYNIMPTGTTHPKLVFCDMKSDTYNDVPQIEQPDDSPLGTITAWVSKPAGDGSLEPLADGWVLCDGSVIEKGIWAGARTPDLNSGHFLRGGNLGQQLQMETDQLQDHKHTDHYPNRHHRNTASTTVSVSTSTSVNSHSAGISGVTSSYRHGAETRPKNMKVSWIMKCW